MVYYLAEPPGPRRARWLFEHYRSHHGKRLARWISTRPGGSVQPYLTGTGGEFLGHRLPALRSKADWGYAFDDGKEFDGHLFMFHGFRPHSEPDLASFVRYEFPWNVDPLEVRAFAIELADHLPFLAGFGGWFLQCDPTDPAGFDRMYAVCRRYWGVEAWNLDVTVRHILAGYKSVNWLTFVGSELCASHPDACDAAEQGATWAHRSASGGLVLQAGAKPILGDQNYQVPMAEHVEIAKALFPLQIRDHASFGGTKWDDDNSIAWIRRFTHPQDV